MLGRLRTVDDVMPLVVLLISPESSWTSGAGISVDGGGWPHGDNKRQSEFPQQASAPG